MENGWTEALLEKDLEIAALTKQLETHKRLNVKYPNGANGCCCLFDDEENPISWCKPHADLRDENLRLMDGIAKMKAEAGRLRDDYNDLIMKVSKKYPDETRHQTAKRYIKLAERGTIGGMGSGGSLKQEAKNESK